MAQNFVDHKMTLRASREFERTAVNNTEETPMDNGEFAYNGRWRYPKMEFTADFALVTPKTQLEITSAFHACWSRLFLFRFRDPGDFEVKASPLFPEIGTRNPVQLTKRYYFGPLAYRDRRIQAVDHAVVKHDGVEVAGVLDNATGMFTPGVDWAAGTFTWDGRYCLWVRFADDRLNITMLTNDVHTASVVLREGRAIR